MSEPTDPARPPENPYGVPPLGSDTSLSQRPDGSLPAARTSGGGLANYGPGLGSYLLDGIITSVVTMIPALIGTVLVAQSASQTAENINPDGSYSGEADVPVLGIFFLVLSFIIGLAFTIWNYVLRQGTTGQTLGKKAVGIYVVSESSHQPIGPGAAFGRMLVAYALSTLTCGIGFLADYLWPLWDDKRQTLHDKVVKAIVVTDPPL